MEMVVVKVNLTGRIPGAGKEELLSQVPLCRSLMTNSTMGLRIVYRERYGRNGYRRLAPQGRVTLVRLRRAVCVMRCHCTTVGRWERVKLPFDSRGGGDDEGSSGKEGPWKR